MGRRQELAALRTLLLELIQRRSPRDRALLDSSLDPLADQSLSGFACGASVQASLHKILKICPDQPITRESLLDGADRVLVTGHFISIVKAYVCYTACYGAASLCCAGVGPGI